MPIGMVRRFGNKVYDLYHVYDKKSSAKTIAESIRGRFPGGTPFLARVTRERRRDGPGYVYVVWVNRRMK